MLHMLAKVIYLLCLQAAADPFLGAPTDHVFVYPLPLSVGGMCVLLPTKGKMLN